MTDAAQDPHYKTATELLDILIGRELRVPDRALALHFLDTIGYHRLSSFFPAFWTAHKTFDAKLAPTLDLAATLDDVFHLYSFDRRLRLLMLGPLEKLEVALRALIVREVGDFQRLSRGTDGQLDLTDARIYDLRTSQNRRNHDIAVAACRKGAWDHWEGRNAKTAEGKALNKRQKRRLFDKYYRDLPAWRVLQLVTFGPLVHIFSILRPEIGIPIAKRFGLHRSVLTTAFYALKELRNACAHHDPIWNWNALKREVRPAFPRPYADAARVRATNEHRLYAYCAIVHILLSYLSNGHSTWHRRLKKLVNEFNTMYSDSMGFPEDWQTLPFWCVQDVRNAIPYSRLRAHVSARLA